MGKAVLVTGAAGFIGFHLCRRLLDAGREVVGVDNMNPYYDVSLKESRLAILESYRTFTFHRLDIADYQAIKSVFAGTPIKAVCNLAAQAGVRYSLKDPFAYQKSNIEGFLNLLEIIRENPVDNFVYASSSSVYGGCTTPPFSVEERTDGPISLYAATKKADELIAHAYSHLHGIPCTGLRYFTVYGPWGRPDMALFLFTDAILNRRPIDVFNYGRMRRDFTYIDDIIDGTVAAIDKPSRYEIFNLGNSKPVELLDFIGIIEDELGIRAEKRMLPMQPGDVEMTAADITRSTELLGFTPQTPVRKGIRNFLSWYRDYYRVHMTI
ncbi:MAG TPA: NAD-dependent epimerase/dehydratase family protein [Desulfobacteraceae bacterium]|jgi:UDP-glucuronate 4-epimerase|nr:NAD-dependent epimerase/dehydratase family protein [Desulfobacteraceae bacterium]